MYLARARFVFEDNSKVPEGIGTACYSQASKQSYAEPTIGDVLSQCQVSWAFFAEGYAAVSRDPSNSSNCWPYYYDASDNPFEYYDNWRDNAEHELDYGVFASLIQQRQLPAVSFIKALGYKSEHPGYSRLSVGQAFVDEVVTAVQSSDFYAPRTLIVITSDESGGYWDHYATPPDDNSDGMPYGPRIPTIAVGTVVKPSSVAHIPMEHSSLLRFLEWNFVGGAVGQLQTRDGSVNNIGSLLDPVAAGVVVPGDPATESKFISSAASIDASDGGGGGGRLATVGVIVGVTLGVAVLVVAFAWWYSRKRRAAGQSSSLDGISFASPPLSSVGFHKLSTDD